jgi:hypothetical protein
MVVVPPPAAKSPTATALVAEAIFNQPGTKAPSLSDAFFSCPDAVSIPRMFSIAIFLLYQLYLIHGRHN